MIPKEIATKPERLHFKSVLYRCKSLWKEQSKGLPGYPSPVEDRIVEVLHEIMQLTSGSSTGSSIIHV